ncbi:TonB-dependent receptor [Lutibacter sp. HS1-25]|uniref:TonB-dependent receptor plug domain-containing protein n=1 Tax=Lutibacter sp. HS1-25 TaxID=2485000 RepID=UPI0010114732|nr:TonB-dependent receptor [Lutibacter sp. HS1-25]RXP64434.1 TonB-dependent receptor [Lutibacter sp. HS1-25]
MRILFLFLLFIVTLSVKAQKVRLLERGSGFPIENVTIYNETKGIIVYTDKKGIANLSLFNDSDIISFNHIGFYEYEILKRELSVIEYVVYLNKKAEFLEEIVLSASKGNEVRSRIAEQVDVVSEAEILRLAPQTSADLLAFLPGVRVQKSQFGGGSPVLRGMEANRVLLVVDGVRMNNGIYRTGHLQNSISVSPNILERTEVLFGPSSVVYGSDALGGVIHYYTKSPKVSEKTIINSAIFSRYSTANNEITTEGNLELRFKKWASFTDVTYSNFGDLRMGDNRTHGFDTWGKVYEYSNNTSTYYNPNPVQNSNPNIQKNTNFSQTDVLQKFVVPLSDNTEFDFNFQYSVSSNNPRFDNLTEYSGGELKFAEWYYGPQKRLLISPQLKINPDKKLLESGTIVLAYQNIKESRVQRKFTSLDGYYRDETVNVLSLNGDFFVPLTKDETRVFSYGGELTYNKVDSDAIGKTLEVYNNSVIGIANEFTIQSRYPEGGSTYSSAAAYINYRQNISKRSTLNTGVRLTGTHLTAKWIDDTFIILPDMDISLNNAAVTATVGYIFRPSVNWQMNGVVSSGFRSPNIDDIGKIREKGGEVTVPNMYLKPEYAYNFETTILKYFNNKTFQTGLNIYYTLLHNYITRDYFDLNGSSTIIYDGEEVLTMANVNKKNAYIFGGTFSVNGNFNANCYANGSITYTQGKAYDTKDPLSSIPPLFGSLGTGYQNERFNVGVKWIFNGKKSIDKYNLVEGIDNIEQTPYNASLDTYYGSPSWYIFNINANYKLNKNFSFFVNFDNIFDTHYKEFASAISAPGRNFSASLLINI